MGQWTSAARQWWICMTRIEQFQCRPDLVPKARIPRFQIVQGCERLLGAVVTSPPERSRDLVSHAGKPGVREKPLHQPDAVELSGPAGGGGEDGLVGTGRGIVRF